MANLMQSLVIIGLALAAPQAAADGVLRQHGVSGALAMLAGACAPDASRAGTDRLRTPACAPDASDAGVRRVSAPMRAAPRKLALAGVPVHAHPSGPASPPLRNVDTGGTRINMDGMAAGAGAAGVTGAVGEQQYVQLVGAAMAVYRKQDGALQSGPASTHALFAGAGLDACTAAGGGAPSVLYDQLEKRWLLSWLAGAPGRNVQCIAVSTTPDAGGSYYRYAMGITGAGGAALRADDARSALWPDAYYFTFSLFDNAQGSYRGPRICAIERLALVRGRDAAMHCKDAGAALGPAVVASLEGDAVPPKGTPAPILSLDFTDDGNGARVLLWRFSFASASIGAPLAIGVAPFRIACAQAPGRPEAPEAPEAPCIGQPHPGVPLFAPGDRLMPRAVYRRGARQDASGEALVLTHAVQLPDGRTGLRWYELRDPLGAVHVYQQGTHAPDGAHRAMGSIGIDQAGNIALGYSVAGPDTPPGVRYTGRQRSDPPGRMQAEETVVNGTGVQPGGARALGAAGALALDPADGCTFWYTQRYLPLTGRLAWRTRIASFKFRNCM